MTSQCVCFCVKAYMLWHFIDFLQRRSQGGIIVRFSPSHKNVACFVENIDRIQCSGLKKGQHCVSPVNRPYIELFKLRIFSLSLRRCESSLREIVTVSALYSNQKMKDHLFLICHIYFNFPMYCDFVYRILSKWMALYFIGKYSPSHI